MFADKLKELRKKKGVTQAQLADAIYVSRSLIAKFETGASYPNKDTLEKIALYFGISVSGLVETDETVLIAVENKNLTQRIEFWSSVVILAVAFVFAIMVFVPFLRGSRYVYPIQPGQSYPEREFFQTSIFMGTYEHGNPIGLISFFLSLFTSVSATLSLVLKKAKYIPILKLGSYVLFFVDIFVSFAAVVCCLSYISQENVLGYSYDKPKQFFDNVSDAINGKIPVKDTTTRYGRVLEFHEKIKSISEEYKKVSIVVSIQKDHGAEKYKIITIYPGKKGE